MSDTDSIFVGTQRVSSHRKPKCRNLEASAAWPSGTTWLRSLWWRQVMCPFPRGLVLGELPYCWPCSGKSPSPSVDCISVSPSGPHQIFSLKSKKDQKMRKPPDLCSPPVRGVSTHYTECTQQCWSKVPYEIQCIILQFNYILLFSQAQKQFQVFYTEI